MYPPPPFKWREEDVGIRVAAASAIYEVIRPCLLFLGRRRRRRGGDIHLEMAGGGEGGGGPFTSLFLFRPSVLAFPRSDSSSFTFSLSFYLPSSDFGAISPL